MIRMVINFVSYYLMILKDNEKNVVLGRLLFCSDGLGIEHTYTANTRFFLKIMNLHFTVVALFPRTLFIESFYFSRNQKLSIRRH